LDTNQQYFLGLPNPMFRLNPHLIQNNGSQF
jgi:hypothetical protein